MAETADAVVVGGGIMGCSIAYHLAKKSVGRVVLLEKDGLASGATGHSGAVIRCHYSNKITAEMALLSRQVFENFTEVVGYDSGFNKTGLLAIVSDQDRPSLEQNVALQRDIGIKVSMVEADDVANIAPYFTVPENCSFCFEDDAGYVDPVKTTHAFANRARELGAKIYEGTAVTGLRKDGAGIAAVETEHGEITTRCVINAANAWAPRLAATVGLELPIYACRAQIASFRQPPDAARNHLVTLDFVNQVYWRPDLATHTCVGSISPDEALDRCDPDDFNEAPDETFIRHAHTSLNARMADLRRGVRKGGWASFYDITPDWHPFLSSSPVDGLYLACGFSGHGLKFGPIIGKLMSELILDGKATTLDLTPFRFERYEQDDPIGGDYEHSVIG